MSLCSGKNTLWTSRVKTWNYRRFINDHLNSFPKTNKLSITRYISGYERCNIIDTLPVQLRGINLFNSFRHELGMEVVIYGVANRPPQNLFVTTLVDLDFSFRGFWRTHLMITETSIICSMESCIVDPWKENWSTTNREQ